MSAVPPLAAFFGLHPFLPLKEEMGGNSSSSFLYREKISGIREKKKQKTIPQVSIGRKPV